MYLEYHKFNYIGCKGGVGGVGMGKYNLTIKAKLPNILCFFLVVS